MTTVAAVRYQPEAVDPHVSLFSLQGGMDFDFASWHLGLRGAAYFLTLSGRLLHIVHFLR